MTEPGGASDVTVLGLGNMGSALVRAFAAHGRSVTVWNRSPGRVVDAPVAHAASAADAIAASPVTVVCLADDDALLAVLGDDAVTAALPGRTLVNLNTSTPAQAAVVDAVARQAGASYLDGAIPLYPVYVGRPDVGLFYSGPADVWEAHRDLLADLGGTSWHVGEAIEAASALDMGICIGFYTTAMNTFLESAVFAQRSGVPLGKALAVARDCLDILKEQIGLAVEEIESGSFVETDQSSVDVHLRTVEMVADAMAPVFAPRPLTVTTTIADLARASRAGLGAMSMPALTRTLLQEVAS